MENLANHLILRGAPPCPLLNHNMRRCGFTWLPVHLTPTPFIVHLPTRLSVFLSLWLSQIGINIICREESPCTRPEETRCPWLQHRVLWKQTAGQLITLAWWLSWMDHCAYERQEPPKSWRWGSGELNKDNLENGLQHSAAFVAPPPFPPYFQLPKAAQLMFVLIFLPELGSGGWLGVVV